MMKIRISVKFPPPPLHLVLDKKKLLVIAFSIHMREAVE